MGIGAITATIAALLAEIILSNEDLSTVTIVPGPAPAIAAVEIRLLTIIGITTGITPIATSGSDVNFTIVSLSTVIGTSTTTFRSLEVIVVILRGMTTGTITGVIIAWLGNTVGTAVVAGGSTAGLVGGAVVRGCAPFAITAVEQARISIRANTMRTFVPSCRLQD